MLHAVQQSFEQIFSPPFRAILLKSVGLTILLLLVIGGLLFFAMDWLLGGLIASYLPESSIYGWLLGVGLGIGLAFLVGPTSSLFAGLFTDEIAEAVEKRYYAVDRPGTAQPVPLALYTSLKFTLAVIAVNLLALLIFFLPGVNIGIFFLANGYLLGREYFEVAALRHMSNRQVKNLRRRHGLKVFIAGLLIAGLMALPVINILTPLFATAFMVHIFKQTAEAAPS